jgi:Peptidase family M48
MKRKIVLYYAAALLCSILVSPLAAQPQTCNPPVALPSATEPNIFSEEQEIYLGDAIAEHIQRNFRVIEDTDVTGYLTRLGERLAKHLPLNQLRFQFFLVDLPDANAFVLPGGRIFVSRKLVAAAQTEDELASVMAHEMGHLVVHQGAVDMTRMFREVLGITQVSDRRDVFDKYNQLIDNVARKPSASKPQDREKGQLTADQAGLFALVTAGYDPSAMPRFWDRVNETKGKKGSWLSDLFGTTRPEEKRLREMMKGADAVPPSCKQPRAINQSEDFKQWQSEVISYNGLGRKESLHGILSRQQLSPPLRSDIIHLRFSPNGNYILAQDDAGINVLTREPFVPLFRIETPYDAYYANFTPDSQSIVFQTDNLRVERWSVAEERLIDVREVVVRKGCLQTQLSPDGKLLACLGLDYDLSLINVESGEAVWRKKDFYSPEYGRYLMIITELLILRPSGSDLNLGLINMRFSPDGHFFVAGCYSALEYKRKNNGDVAEVLDTNTLAKVSIPDSLKKLIVGGFTFIDNDRLAGINESNVKKSAVVKFPSGELLSEIELWRKGMTAPTRGDYLLIRPVKDFPLGVLDLKTKTYTKANEHAALDIFDPFFVAERRNGELGLYRLEKNQVVDSTVLSNQTLGRMRVAELSADMKWLALSGRSRGGVWNLARGDAALSLRSFQGGYLSDDGYFFGYFPKYEQAERNVAKFNLLTGEIVQGPKVENGSAQQFGRYLFMTKSGKTRAKQKEDFEFVGKSTTTDLENIEYRSNMAIEMLDARTMKSLWSRTYAKESPRVWIAASQGTLALAWDANDEAARDEIKRDARLSRQLSQMKEKEGNYLVEILAAADASELGKLLIETGKGSFQLANAFGAGDWAIISDTQNRVLIYSLKSGEQKGRVFGGSATVSLAKNLLGVENERGKLALYDLNTMDKRDEFVFSSPISMFRFSPDGSRLFVLTVNQTVYLLDVSSTAAATPK